ncbi:MAG TPA: TspO/MBR family protein [Longimicrobiales bacterium]|nr:TspO/MBR family protein [Longimicrobiales bacterium]
MHWQIVNAVTLLVVLAANGMAGSGALSGESIGVVANRYPSYFLPAGWVFGIWSLIYLWLLAFTVYQALPAQRRSGFVERVGPWWLVNGALNVGWVVAFSFSLFGPAMALIVALLVCLIVMGERLGAHRPGVSLADRAFGAWPFGLYLAWVSVAVIANAAQYLTYLGWGGWGVPDRIWSVVMMAAATALGLGMVIRRGVWLYPIVVGWALVGIADQYAGDALIVRTAWAMTALGLLGLALVTGVRRRGGAAPPP